MKGPIGVLGAIPEEVDSLVREMTGARVTERGMRTYHRGILWGKEAVVVYSRVGKVSAAAAATELIAGHGVNRIVFTGVAGAASAGVCVGDVVVGTELIQHDVDASPLFPRYEIPYLGVSTFAPDAGLARELAVAASRFLWKSLSSEIPAGTRSEFGLARPRLLEGQIASGDRFFADARELEELRARLPAVLCVEMEGAAVAQVCHEYGVPFCVVRTISDSADHRAAVDFPRFVSRVASRYSRGIIHALLTEMENPRRG